MNETDLIEAGMFKDEYNQLLGINLPAGMIYQSKGLSTHMKKRKHFKCLKYLDRINEILDNPDFIGVNPNEENSIELIKKFDDNVLIGIKLDTDKNYLYISTMHDVQESKIDRRLHSGRLKLLNKGLDTKVL